MDLLEKCIVDFTAEYKIPTDAVDTHWAVKKAYGDMTPRTIKGHKEAIREASIAELEKWFEKYLAAPARDKEDFKSAHKEACNVFLTSFNEAARENGVQEQAFGKAQKIINMSFKYLYCMLRHKKEDWFSYCHMPLDSYTLNWFYRTEENGTKISKKETWSNLDDKRYYSIADKIESHVDTQFPGLGLSPLEAEFMIWPIEKSMVLLKELKSAISRSCSDQIITAHLGKERIKNLQEIGKAEVLTFEKAYEYAMQE